MRLTLSIASAMCMLSIEMEKTGLHQEHKGVGWLWMLVESVHVSNSVVGSTSHDLSRLELTIAKLKKSGSRSRTDLVVTY